MLAKTILTRRTIALTLLLTAATATYAQEENLDTVLDATHILAYTVAGLLIGLCIQFFRNRLFIYKERDVNTQYHNQIGQLAVVLQTRKVRVWTFDTKNSRFHRLAKDGTVEGDYSPIDFSQGFEQEDFEHLRQSMADVQSGKTDASTLIVKGRQPKDTKHAQKQYKTSIKVLERDSHGRPRQLIGMQHDITSELQKESKTRELLMQYYTVFNQSLLDMVYYDADGTLTDINDRACETFGIKDRRAFLQQKPTIRQNPGFDGIGLDLDGTHHFTSIIPQDDTSMNIPGIHTNLRSSLFYEMTFSPIHNVQGQLTGIFSAGRNVTETAESYHEQQEAMRRLQRATQSIEAYIQNINYALQVSEVRLMNYYPQTHLLEISNTLNKPQYRLTQMRCVTLIDTDQRRQARRMFRQMDSLRDTKIEQSLRTILRDEKHRSVWLTFNIIPVYTPDGRVDHYFGMCRNETEMIATEKQLKEETEKAREAELLKDAFLTNMSHELRTPLNAVLGFAELLKQEHDPADEPIFVNEIKENSNKLLALVNDGLYLSRLDARMVELKPEPTDFALVFESHCQLGWSNNLKPNVKTLIENPYNRLTVDIDNENLGQVIQKLCANAASSTQEGTIRAKYEYRRGELNITIEDTGHGMDNEELAHVFDRFSAKSMEQSHETGLGMPIVKELVEQMGGFIDISSEKGKGTTVWVTLPCPLRDYDKKKEILAS